MAQTVKRLPTMRETWFHSLGGEDPLEKEIATHSSILAWKIPWTEKPSRLHFSVPGDSPGKNTGVAMPSSRGSSQPRDRTQVSHSAGGFFTV